MKSFYKFIENSWQVIHTNVIFELVAKSDSATGDEKKDDCGEDKGQPLSSSSNNNSNNNHRDVSLHLKGHMMFIQLLEMMLFLSSPV